LNLFFNEIFLGSFLPQSSMYFLFLFFLKFNL